MYSRQKCAEPRIDRNASMYSPQKWASVGAWFLGPKAENHEIFKRLESKSIADQVAFREGYFPCDPVYITDEMKANQTYKDTVKKLEDELHEMTRELHKSVPFFSSRYKGHVLWETLMPANLGYMAALLYNQNNCTMEASPVTTKYELKVGSGLCEMLGFEKGKSMGHLVAGGSIANIEAIWVARNLKYYALGLQEAVAKEPKLKDAQSYQVAIPHQKTVPLSTSTPWQLLNLNIDTIIKMPEGVLDWVNAKHETKISKAEFEKMVNKYAYETLGAQEFCHRHKIKPACFIVPSTYHVSLVKAATILGLGKDNMVIVPVDECARMKSDELQAILQVKLAENIPVICVVPVMGTTEESAIDPLTKVLEIRDVMREKGLNFSIHADGAWGGYFASMLKEPILGCVDTDLKEPPKDRVGHTDPTFVPKLALSKYVKKQIEAFRHCDTITIDPHKSGFCPYPAGGICYRDKKMNDFLNVTENGKFYYHGNDNLGDVGLEGSKPGAAAAGVMLAHRVVGLNKNGYGRILAECTFTAKILYCAWVTLAQQSDKFKLVPLHPLPRKDTDLIKKKMIEILHMTNEELAQDEDSMEFLREIGPDTLMPCFAVNLEGNTSVETCNEINEAIFENLSHKTDEVTAKRIPMLVTSSTLVNEKHHDAFKQFTRQLGLNPFDQEGVKYIITTCMDPWATSNGFIRELAAEMRNTILCAIGTVTDNKSYHDFLAMGWYEKEVIVYHECNFRMPEHQYFAVAKLGFVSDKDAFEFHSMACGTSPFVFRNSKEDKLHTVLFGIKDGEQHLPHRFDIYKRTSSTGNHPVMTDVKMKVLDVPRFHHFDPLAKYPTCSTYFMYGAMLGKNYRAFISHIPTMKPDFEQLIELKKIPEGMLPVVLKHGVVVHIPEVSGAPKIVNCKIVNNLTKKIYKICFIGYKEECKESIIKIDKRIWFNGEQINGEQINEQDRPVYKFCSTL